MRAYSIFDDYPVEAVSTLKQVGVEVTVHPLGVARPDDDRMKEILNEYECIIIGTSQKIKIDMFEGIETPRIIATASVGVDHIRIPDNKRGLVKIINSPGSNTVSVAEYVIGALLLARKRYFEGNSLYGKGYNNKMLIRKPEDIYGATVGLIGAGRISTRIMELLQPFGVHILCYTKHPDAHKELIEQFKIQFTTLEEVVKQADMLAVCVPETDSTYNLIDESIVANMKESCVFISIAREKVTNIKALIQKANTCPNFYVILDVDVVPEYTSFCNGRNIIITPHIAGGTIESRKRMFMDIAERITKHIQSI